MERRADGYDMFCEMEIKSGIKAEYDFGRQDAIVTVMNNGVAFVQDCATGKLDWFGSYEEAASKARFIVAKNRVW